MTTLYLIRGIPGSGKSTLAQNLYSFGMVEAVIEADDYFYTDGMYHFDPSMLGTAHDWCKGRTSLYLSANLSVAVSNTSTTEKEVAVYKELAEKYNARFISLVVENRHGGVNIHNVPEENLQRMKNRFSLIL